MSVNAEGHFLATSLEFNGIGNELLVNIGSDNIYIFDVKKGSKHKSPDILSTIKRLEILIYAKSTFSHYHKINFYKYGP